MTAIIINYSQLWTKWQATIIAPKLEDKVVDNFWQAKVRKGGNSGPKTFDKTLSLALTIWRLDGFHPSEGYKYVNIEGRRQK